MAAVDPNENILSGQLDPHLIVGRKLFIAIVGFLFFLVSVYLWSLEGNEGYHLHLDDEHHHS